MGKKTATLEVAKKSLKVKKEAVKAESVKTDIKEIVIPILKAEEKKSLDLKKLKVGTECMLKKCTRGSSTVGLEHWVGTRIRINGGLFTNTSDLRNYYVVVNIDEDYAGESGSVYYGDLQPLTVLDTTKYKDIADLLFSIDTYRENLIAEEDKRLKKKLKAIRYELVNNIKRSVASIYDDKFDITNTTENDFTLTIHFPEVVITQYRADGKQGIKRTLRDIFVQIDLKFSEETLDFKFVNSMRGCRTTVTENEQASNYVHSHLPANNTPYIFHNFCLGHSEFAQVFSDMKIKWDDNKFNYFLVFLNTYIEQESEEGGPYIKLQNITSGSRSIPGFFEESIIKNSYKKIINHIDKDSFLTVNTDSEPTFKIDATDPKFIELCNKYIDDNKCYRAVNGNWYVCGSGNNRGTARENITTALKFRGKDVKYSIIKDTEDSTVTSETNPNLIKKLAERLTNNINNYYLDKVK